jgi:hypothetical protein
MTSFARSSTLTGIVRPICFAALRLMMKFKLRCLLYGKISRFGAFQDFVDVVGGAPKEVNGVDPVIHESTLNDKLLLEVNCRQPVFSGNSTIRFLSAKNWRVVNSSE